MVPLPETEERLHKFRRKQSVFICGEPRQVYFSNQAYKINFVEDFAIESCHPHLFASAYRYTQISRQAINLWFTRSFFVTIPQWNFGKTNQNSIIIREPFYMVWEKIKIKESWRNILEFHLGSYKLWQCRLGCCGPCMRYT